MTVSSSLSTQSFSCDGSTTVFTCPFRVLEASELVGYLITVATNESTPLVNGADFAVTGVGSTNAVATTTLAYSSDYRVNFRRRTQRLQSTDYRDNDPFPAESHEDALDRLTHIAQENDADIGRALLVPEPESGVTLPAASVRAGYLLGFDAEGDPVAVAPTSGSAADLALDLASSAPGKGAAMVALKRTDIANTVATTLRLWHERQWAAPEDMAGADDTARLAAAVAASPAGGVIVLRAGTSYAVGSVNFTGKRLTVIGHGATVVCTSATGAIYKTDHNNTLKVYGITFTSSTAGARAINHQSAPETSVTEDLLIEGCSFTMAGAYGLYLVGTREPAVNDCWFYDTNGGDGVYLKDAVAPAFVGCIFKGSSYTRRAIYYPGTGNGTDASPMLINCEVMGWDKGVEIVGCDSLVIVGGTYDYCNWTMKIASQDGGHISHAYIGSVAANPAVWITSDASASSPDHVEKLVFQNCTFTGHFEGGSTYDNVLIDGAVSSDHVAFDVCYFTFYTRYGLNFTTTGRLKVRDCTFAQRTGFGGSPIYNASGANDSGVVIRGNTFANGATLAAMNVTAFAQVNENIGCVTEARGEAFVGSGVSTYNQAHGCAYTPAKSDVSLTATNSEAAGKNPFIQSVDATNIVINFTAATAATAGIAWRVRRGA